MINIEEHILDSSLYKYDLTKDKIFTASMFGNDDIQNFLIIKHKKDIVSNRSSKTDQSTLGSVFHRGLEVIFSGIENVEVEKKVRLINVYNDWDVTATIDYFGIDNDKKIIYLSDHKLTKKFSGIMVKKDYEASGYFWQLQVQKFILSNIEEYKGYSFDLALNMFYKDANSALDEPVQERIALDVLDNEFIYDKLVDKLSLLDLYLEQDKEPPECEQKWFRKINRTSVPTKCETYCSVNYLCRYYNKKSMVQSIKDF